MCRERERERERERVRERERDCISLSVSINSLWYETLCMKQTIDCLYANVGKPDPAQLGWKDKRKNEMCLQGIYLKCLDLNQYLK